MEKFLSSLLNIWEPSTHNALLVLALLDLPLSNEQLSAFISGKSVQNAGCNPKCKIVWHPVNQTWFIAISYSMTFISRFRETLYNYFFFFYFEKLLISSSSQARYTTFTNISADYFLLCSASTVMLLTVVSYTDIIPKLHFCRCSTPKDSVHLATLLPFPWNTMLYVLILF